MPNEQVSKITDDSFLHDVIQGLSGKTKTLPCKYFYDERGSVLFDAICELPEYYPTRTELKIMKDNASAIGSSLGKGVLLIEFGSGSSLKTRILLDNLVNPVAYIPVDISEEHLNRSASSLAESYPKLVILPVCADFTEKFSIPETEPADKTVIYFPGSTIGNFEEDEAKLILNRWRRLCVNGGGLLIGIDLIKDQKILEAAYNDEQGVTADFNLNILDRINKELGANFKTTNFTHRAHCDTDKSRVEMHLVSNCQQTALIDGHQITLEEGETIHTESSHKYTFKSFAEIASSANFKSKHVWIDENSWFGVYFLEAV